MAGTAVCDDGIVIDLSAMRAVSVDPAERTAQVQGGALWGDVDHETQAHGLATTGGIVGHTGVGGLSLGGGIGWLMRKHGLTVDNLVEAEVVTASGDIVRASANDHPDLFWALRGGGGNFGVVTSFRFALHPVGPTVIAGPVFWAAEDTTDVMRFYREFVADAPDELGTVIRLGTIPPLPVISHELHFRPAIAVACCYAGPVEDGERAVRALRQFGTPLVDLVGPTLYVDHQSGLDDTVPHGWHYYWKATNLDGSVRRRHRRRRAARLSRQVTEVVRGDVPHGWRGCPSPPRCHRISRPRRRPQHHHRRRMAPGPRTTRSARPRPRGPGASSTLSNPTAPASTSTSSTPTMTPAEFARPTATTPTGGSPRSRRSTTPTTLFHHNKNIEPGRPRGSVGAPHLSEALHRSNDGRDLFLRPSAPVVPKRHVLTRFEEPHQDLHLPEDDQRL